MRPVSPDCEYREVTLAEEQLDLMPLVVAIDDEGVLGRRFITRWRLTQAERAKLLQGEDLALIISTRQFPPVMLGVWSDMPVNPPDTEEEDTDNGK